MAAKQTHHFVRFALSHEPVVDEHAEELVADRLVDEHGRDRRIDAARQTTDDARLADLDANAGDLLVAEGGHRPVAFDLGDLEKKVGEELGAVGRMGHLGMEHGRVVAARFIGRDRVRRVLRHRIDPEAFRQARHAVAVAHPHRIAAARSPHAVEQGAGFEDLDVRPAEFGGVTALDLAAQLLAQGLLAVADGENRNAAFEDFRRRARAPGFGNRRRPAGQNHRFWLQPRERFARFRERVDFAIDARLAHAPRDQLRDLRAEVDDEDEVMAHAASCGAKSGRAQWRAVTARANPHGDGGQSKAPQPRP